ncbi:hypothetical protein ACFW6S_23620 [Streptomyces sp. NPDC058740]|uniref:hypothetical protein n=1 Tax=unclassified Streptomyces TaxID=2593676 RepID=UPI0036BCA338
MDTALPAPIPARTLYRTRLRVLSVVTGSSFILITPVMLTHGSHYWWAVVFWGVFGLESVSRTVAKIRP